MYSRNNVLNIPKNNLGLSLVQRFSKKVIGTSETRP